MGLFDGKVAAITGAGGGIGREYALAFAREGAKVVVNDLGGSRDGTGSGSTMAEKVVAEIKELGGEAAPSFDNVATEEGAANIVRVAVDNFGRLDILVNNAGILRDKTLFKLTPDLWDPVINVHLKGTYLCTRAAAMQMKEQGEGGRIINTSSIAGLVGNFGQCNYSAAKAGIYGFTRTAALELRRPKITVNCIAPVAKTRMTDDIDAVPGEAKPEFIAPMVLFLASDMAADITGRIFGVHGNHLFEYKMELTRGVDKGEEVWTPSEVKDRLKEIARTEAEYVKAEAAKAGPAAAVDPQTKALKVFEAMASAFLADKAGDWKAVLHFEIDGAGDLTMNIADGKISVAKGKQGDSTCVVKLADDTFFGMAEGKVDGTQAFMQGKITATNMGDMIKYGTCFDQKKAQAAVKDALAALAAAGGAPATVDPATKGLKVFEAMASAFLPDKAGDWKAVMHFEVEGAGEYTMKVEGGTCSVSKGKEGDATCVVKLADETFFGMAEGKVDGTQAFMQGKITATNMGDMIKYGTCFDQKKAQAAVKEALASMAAGGGAPAAMDPATKGLKVLEAMATAFLPDKAGDWKAVLHFEVEGAGEYTMKVEGGACEVADGKQGDASCVVKMADETFFGMAEGKVDGTQAFMQGKITATNMGDMIKYGTCFNQKKAQAAVKEALAGGGAPAAEDKPAAAEEKPRPVGLNRECLGNKYVSAPFFVTPKHTIGYAKATNDENPFYVDEGREGGIVAPVIFPVRVLHPNLEVAVLDPELNADLVMLLHGEQDMTFYEPVRPGDCLVVRSEISYMEKKESGEILDITGVALRDNKPVVEAISRCFIRNRDGGKKKSKPKEEPVLPELLFEGKMKVREDQTKDYAEASGDHNPIHLDPEVGKAAGHGGIILHGLCTMAFASQAVVQHAADGDPTRIKRFKVRFSKPVKPGDEVTTQAWKIDETADVLTLGFRVITQNGDVVVTDGVAEVAKA